MLTSVILFAAYRALLLSHSHAYQTHLCHLNNHPPAIIANDFDFANENTNRKISREQLQQYRDNAAICKAQLRPVETIIFRY